MADDPRRGQFGRRWFDKPAMQGAFWGRQPEKRPPDADARQRPPLSHRGTPIADSIPGDGLNIYQRRDSGTPDKSLGTQIHAAAGHLKTGPCHKRRQPNFEHVVTIARRFLIEGRL
jgi:hypothetical protein